MKDFKSLCHTKGDCKYHIVFIPKYRQRVIYGRVRKYLANVFHDLAKQKESRVLEGHLCVDHVHICVSIPPKLSVSKVVGYMKGKSAIAIARDIFGFRQNFKGKGFWVCGYYVSTVGLDEETIREYINNQKHYDTKTHQVSIFDFADTPLQGDKKVPFEELTF